MCLTKLCVKDQNFERAHWLREEMVSRNYLSDMNIIILVILKNYASIIAFLL